MPSGNSRGCTASTMVSREPVARLMCPLHRHLSERSSRFRRHRAAASYADRPCQPPRAGAAFAAATLPTGSVRVTARSPGSDQIVFELVGHTVRNISACSNAPRARQTPSWGDTGTWGVGLLIPRSCRRSPDRERADAVVAGTIIDLDWRHARIADHRCAMVPDSRLRAGSDLARDAVPHGLNNHALRSKPRKSRAADIRTAGTAQCRSPTRGASIRGWCSASGTCGVPSRTGRPMTRSDEDAIA